MARAARRPVNSQRSTAEILGILHKWGIHTLGQLAALNKEELRARLGNHAVTLWLRANGQTNRLLKFVQPPETFEESFEFDHEIETAEPLLFMLRRFLEQLALRLSAIYLVARELTLRISFTNSRQVRHRTDSSDWRNEPAMVTSATRTDKETYQRVFKIPQPTNDVDLLFRMVQTHLENFQSDHPIVAVALSATPVRPVSQQFGLFQTALRNPQQLFETLARLTALVGCDRVGTPVLEETHRPDAFRMEPFCWQIVESAVSSGKIERDSDAPRTAPARAAPVLRRFRPPASTSAFISDRRPALCVKDSSFQRTDKNQGVIGFEGAACETQVRRYLESTKFRGEIVHQTGPFLVSGNWWDEKAWARAEWDMQLEQGELVRAHEDASPARTWKLDGIYD